MHTIRELLDLRKMLICRRIWRSEQDFWLAAGGAQTQVRPFFSWYLSSVR